MASLLLLSFIGILRETFKLFTKNGRIFASIALFTLFANSIGYLSTFYTIKPLITDLFLEGKLLNITNPGTPEYAEIITHIQKDAKTIVFLELIYFTINSAFFLLSTTATILAAAIIYGGHQQDLSLKDLVLTTVKTWLRPLVTWFYTFLFGLVFFLIFGVVILFISLVIKNPAKIIIAAIPLGVIATVLFMYLSVTWILAIVISAIEKIKGIKAIGKAGEIVKGMKKQGFMLNLLLNISVFGVQLVIQLIPVNSISLIVIKGVVAVYFSSLVNMYYFAAYTVIYFMCMKNHGERVELEGSFSGGYSKIPTTPPLVDDKLP